MKQSTAEKRKFSKKWIISDHGYACDIKAMIAYTGKYDGVGMVLLPVLENIKDKKLAEHIIKLHNKSII